MNTNTNNSNMTELQSLRLQIRNISTLATEYRSQLSAITTELNSYRRREPLVQLLWHEIIQLKSALNAAIIQGFAYDVGDAASRYVELKANEILSIQDLDLDVVKTQRAKQETVNALQQSRNCANANAANAFLDSFGPVSKASETTQAQSKASVSVSTESNNLNASPYHSNDNNIPSSTAFVTEAAPAAPSAPPSAPFIGAPPLAPPAPFGDSTKALPTKPVIKPSQKMKPLHWQRLIVPNPEEPSVWNDVNSLDVDIDIDELTDLFMDMRSGITSNRQSLENIKALAEAMNAAHSSSSNSAPKEIRIMNDKRFNAVSIMMTTLPDAATIVHAIRNLDHTILGKDAVAVIRRNLSDDTEAKSLLECSSPSLLSRPDVFMRTIMSISQVGPRLDVWHFQLNFHELYEEIALPFTTNSAAIKAVRNSTAFKHLLALILNTGNYLNGGTIRGQADGFELQVLSRLSTLRDNSGNTTLFNWIVNQAVKQFGIDWTDFLFDELSSSTAACDFSLKQATAAANRFQSLVKTMQNTATLVMANSDVERDQNLPHDASYIANQDPFVAHTMEFFAVVNKETSKLNSEVKQVNDAFTALLKYLNPSLNSDASVLSRISSEDVFRIISDINQQVKDTAEKMKQERLEADRVSRIDEAKKKAAYQKESQKSFISEIEKQRKSILYHQMSEEK